VARALGLLVQEQAAMRTVISLVARPFAARANTVSFRAAAVRRLLASQRHKVACALPAPTSALASEGLGARRPRLAASLTPASPHLPTVATRLPSAASRSKVGPVISAVREPPGDLR